jgi:glycosyltransferase involved in cell wall biosynthesis
LVAKWYQVLAAYGDAIRALRQQNRGSSSARNLGIRHARGEFVALLDADDHWLPAKIERQVAVLRERPEIGFVSTAARVEAPDGTVLGSWDCPKIDGSMLKTLFMAAGAVAGSCSGVVLRRDLLSTAGLFDETLTGLEDTDLWMRLAVLSEYGCIEEPLTVITKYPSSKSRSLDMMRGFALQVMKKNRRLLDGGARRGFWQSAYAGVLADYAKWEYRCGRKLSAMLHLLEGLLRAPVRRGRLMLGLIFAMSRGERL